MPKAQNNARGRQAQTGRSILQLRLDNLSAFCVTIERLLLT